jgi:hypothetical protein
MLNIHVAPVVVEERVVGMSGREKKAHAKTAKSAKKEKPRKSLKDGTAEKTRIIR